jgi:hypothetical protein
MTHISIIRDSLQMALSYVHAMEPAHYTGQEDIPPFEANDRVVDSILDGLKALRDLEKGSGITQDVKQMG